MQIKIPKDHATERKVLGAILSEQEALEVAISILSESDFDNKSNRTIFKTALDLDARGEPVDIVTVSVALGQNLKAVGGDDYLAGLLDEIATTRNIETHCEIIKNVSTLRKLIVFSNEMLKKATDERQNAVELIQDLSESLYKITTENGGKEIDMSDGLLEVMQMIDDAKIKGVDVGIPTGYKQLDKLLGGGLQTGLILLAARPSMGKTAFAMNIARNAAQQGYKVGVFSLETNPNQLILRMIAIDARVNNLLLKTGQLQESEWGKVTWSANKLEKYKIYFDKKYDIKTSELKSKIQYMKRRYNIDLVIIDYLQLIKHPTAENKNNAVGETSRLLKCLAEEIDIPILCLSQLNREVETRRNKRPMLADLRDSGSLEQDADVVMFIYRPKIYGFSTGNEAEIIVAKHREGPVGYIEFVFIDEWASFEEKAIQEDEIDKF